MFAHVVSSIITWYMAHINYLTVTILMAIESSFIPLPSEIVVPPAAWKAAQGELNIFLLFVCATGGALIGSLINYFIALILGRKVLYGLADTKWAHMIKINKKALEKVDNFFVKYGKSSIFIGRLVPAVRHLISIPAGIAKMDLKAFAFYTALGAGIWNIILSALGYFLYSQKELLHQYYRHVSFVLLGLGVLFGIYLLIKVFSKGKPSSQPAAVSIDKSIDKSKVSQGSRYTGVE